jgi:hypothetical protein
VSGSGVTIQTPMLTVSGSGIAAKKAVSDG